MGRTTSGRPLLVLGLSGENMARLLDGDPIYLDTRDMGGQVHVLILGGKDEEAMAAELRKYGLVNDQTVVHDEDGS